MKVDPLTPEEVTALEDFYARSPILNRPIDEKCRRLLATIRDRERERDELHATFDLRWKADMRAIARWRKSNPGNELVLPDQADLCVWLLQEHDELQRKLDELQKLGGDQVGRASSRSGD